MHEEWPYNAGNFNSTIIHSSQLISTAIIPTKINIVSDASSADKTRSPTRQDSAM